jgi:hypothetical protein
MFSRFNDTGAIFFNIKMDCNAVNYNINMHSGFR